MLLVLAAYLAFAGAMNGWWMGQGSGSVVLGVFHLILGGAIALAWTGRIADRWANWIPFAALPVMYWGFPWAAVPADRAMHDPLVAGWDRALFGSDVSVTLAGMLPSPIVSEVLHLSYLLYYATIYLPPLMMHRRRADAALGRTAFAFAIAMVASFVAFNVFPVEGPRYLGRVPPGVPEGFFRSICLFFLEGGSSRGTAFPSSHLAIAGVQALSSYAWSRSLGKSLMAVAGLLGIGAVYGGFHYGVDMLAGALVAGASFAIARRWQPER